MATSNYLNNPLRYRSPHTKYEFNIAKTSALLQAAGYQRGPDGVRAKGKHKLSLVLQAGLAPGAQKMQTIIKSACGKAGIELELKVVTSAVFFGGDAANPDTVGKFWADMQMFSITMGSGGDPQSFMERHTTEHIAQKANKWSSRNVMRWSNADYDATCKAAQTEFDPVKRAALFIRMNDILIADAHVIPLCNLQRVHGIAAKLRAPMSGWDSSTWAIGYWTRES